MSEKIACDHCHLEFSKEVMIEDDGHYFCCNGCQGVFHLLRDQGLDGFYQKLGSEKLAPPSQQYEDSANFDTPAFYERFVKKGEDGFLEVSLIIEGIHCAACVWLNEKALTNMDGVIATNINYTNNKAKIVWDDNVVKLSAIIDMIRAIGYNAYPYDASLQEEKANKERKDYYVRIAVAVFATMNMMTIMVAQYAGYFTGISGDIKNILNIGEWVLATPVLFYSGWPFFKGMYYGMKTKTVNMDTLVATGALLTYIYSIYITLTRNGEAYFDSVTMIVTFVLVGKFLEVLSKKSIADTLDIMSQHLVSDVQVIEDEKIVTKNVNDVLVGETILLNSGDRVAIDGEIIEGSGNFDESSLTGESEPIFKTKGDTVISGTVSIDADIKYMATKDYAHSTMSNIVSLLENAMNNKPRIQQLANKLSEYFSTVILALSFFTFVGWYLYSANFEQSFMIAIAVIVIACPCALALATPVATLVGLSIASKKGILFKEAAQLETMAKADVLTLDKTGTITQGHPEVVSSVIEKEFDLSLLNSLLLNSKHPIAKAVADHIYDETLKCYLLESFKNIASQGMTAMYKGKMLAGGNAKLMKAVGIDVDSSSHNSEFYFAYDDELLGKYELFDMPREDAKEAISKIKKMGIDVVMLTGDHAKSAQRVASMVGIEKLESQMTPQEKANYIESLHARGKTVVMAGDGVNDILALASSDIAIAMGNGSDIAIEVSDVVLLNDTFASLYDSFKISKRTFTMIKENLWLSLVYNGITIPLAMAGYIIPLIAAISMSVSSLLVVGNSLRIKIGYK
ncbi:heavy metal translocating P-type ATPase [Sulfurimonas paralvinellae]|uniref:P-type Cu(+) transporter n=1 Tax=Sulfurimonas paralvinellae TaxID=317658 RepID=A0A7M1B9K7_9BACT|nr:heavy metal translocating P-type ATPase [Sulfurimonas paralvinellae]QOP46136.1 cadmium-translocating P-type ATPase [Sulfurimonas paralvinellae]